MRVLIKTWEQMKHEYGLDSAGDIRCRYCFTRSMENQLPKDRILFVYLNENQLTWKLGRLHAAISEDMVEKILVE